jgi:hypothetical protein
LICIRLLGYLSRVTNWHDVEGLEPASEKKVLTSNWGFLLSHVDKKFRFSSHMADAGAQKQIEMGLSWWYVCTQTIWTTNMSGGHAQYEEDR